MTKKRRNAKMNEQPMLPFAEAPKTNDVVNSPAHYQRETGPECIDWICDMLDDAEMAGYLKGDVLKYIWRYKAKGGSIDLRKARWYLNTLIDMEIEREGVQNG